MSAMVAERIVNAQCYDSALLIIGDYKSVLDKSKEEGGKEPPFHPGFPFTCGCCKKLPFPEIYLDHPVPPLFGGADYIYLLDPYEIQNPF